MKHDEQIIVYAQEGIKLEIGRKYGAIPEPHFHTDEYQIEVLLAGESENLAKCGYEKVIPGFIDVYNPCDPHQTNYHATDSFIFHVKTSSLSQIYQDMNLSHYAPLFNPVNNKPCSVPLPLLYEEAQILKSLQTVTPSDNTIALYNESKVLTLLKLVLQNLEDHKINRCLETVDYYCRLKVEKARDWIHDHFHQDDITINTLAKISHLSRFHFIRVFKTVMGKSPYDYLIDIRVKQALKILEKGRYKNLEEVALLVGFRQASQLRYHLNRLKHHSA